MATLNFLYSSTSHWLIEQCGPITGCLLQEVWVCQVLLAQTNQAKYFWEKPLSCYNILLIMAHFNKIDVNDKPDLR